MKNYKTITTKALITTVQVTMETGEFIVEILADFEKQYYEAWMHKKGMGTKSFMFGLPFTYPTNGYKNTVEEIIDYALSEIEDDAEIYEEERDAVESYYIDKYSETSEKE